MQIEVRNLGVGDSATLQRQARSALDASLERYGDHVRRVRVRFLTDGAGAATCRVRAWCGKGPTVVLEERGASSAEAVNAVADALHRALIRRWSVRLSRLRRPGKMPVALHAEVS